MKLFLDPESDIYITDVGTGDNGKRCKLKYLWIGSDKKGCIGTISGPSLTKLKEWASYELRKPSDKKKQ